MDAEEENSKNLNEKKPPLSTLEIVDSVGKPQERSPQRPSSSLSDKKNSLSAKINELNGDRFVSFEFFPPKTTEGTLNLITRAGNMCEKLKPLFVDVTSSPLNINQSIDICVEILLNCGVEAMLHVTCKDSTKNEMKQVLNQAKKKGIKNIMALFGEVGKPKSEQVGSDEYFTHAHEFVSFIRKEFGDAFTIAVAAYPEGREPG